MKLMKTLKGLNINIKKISLMNTRRFAQNFEVKSNEKPELMVRSELSTGKYYEEDFDKSLTQEQKSKMKKFQLLKYNPEVSSNRVLTNYYVDLKECGPMLLDALIYIKDEIDSTLSFRRSCREGICGSCSMNIDGRNTLACLCYIDTRLNYTTKIMPLPYFTVVRDLVVDMTNFYMQYKQIMPVLQRKTEKVIII